MGTRNLIHRPIDRCDSHYLTFFMARQKVSGSESKHSIFWRCNDHDQNKKLGVLSFAKFQAMLLALAGLLAGVLYSVGGLIVDLFTVGLNCGTSLAFLALVGMPIIFAAIGLVVGLIEAVLYTNASVAFNSNLNNEYR